MPSQREIDAVADILADERNDDLFADQIAELIIAALEDVQAKTNNLIIVGRFSFDGVSAYEAALGPFRTRAVAAARAVGERFAWDYKTRMGSGKYQFLPLHRTPQAAWDHVREREGYAKVKYGREDPHMPLATDVQHAVSEAMRWRHDPDDLSFWGPGCTCGLRNQARAGSGGQFLTEEPPLFASCLRHPGVIE